MECGWGTEGNLIRSCQEKSGVRYRLPPPPALQPRAGNRPGRGTTAVWPPVENHRLLLDLELLLAGSRQRSPDPSPSRTVRVLTLTVFKICSSPSHQKVRGSRRCPLYPLFTWLKKTLSKSKPNEAAKIRSFNLCFISTLTFVFLFIFCMCYFNLGVLNGARADFKRAALFKLMELKKKMYIMFVQETHSTTNN